MEAVIFCGIQASGKTSFYSERFLKTHVRISLDLFRTRNREDVFLQTCLETHMQFVVDNTNPTRKDRQRYIDAIKGRRCKLTGYFFHSLPHIAIERNKSRTGKEVVPIPGIRGTHKRLEPLRYDEGFGQLWWVELTEEGFVVTEGEFSGDAVL
jgi:predicted kinase